MKGCCETGLTGRQLRTIKGMAVGASIKVSDLDRPMYLATDAISPLTMKMEV
jgi:hypothetical protein